MAHGQLIISDDGTGPVDVICACCGTRHLYASPATARGAIAVAVNAADPARVAFAQRALAYWGGLELRDAGGANARAD